MHELSVCLNILKILEQQAISEKFSRVKAIWLEVGMFANIEKEALLFSFPLAAKNTLAEGAQLNIIDIPAQAKCQECQKLLSICHYADACPHCGKYEWDIIKGRELRINEVEVI